MRRVEKSSLVIVGRARQTWLYWPRRPSFYISYSGPGQVSHPALRSVVSEAIHNTCLV